MKTTSDTFMRVLVTRHQALSYKQFNEDTLLAQTDFRDNRQNWFAGICPTLKLPQNDTSIRHRQDNPMLILNLSMLNDDSIEAPNEQNRHRQDKAMLIPNLSMLNDDSIEAPNEQSRPRQNHLIQPACRDLQQYYTSITQDDCRNDAKRARCTSWWRAMARTSI
jgi:hypothetical protein